MEGHSKRAFLSYSGLEDTLLPKVVVRVMLVPSAGLSSHLMVIRCRRVRKKIPQFLHDLSPPPTTTSRLVPPSGLGASTALVNFLGYSNVSSLAIEMLMVWKSSDPETT